MKSVNGAWVPFQDDRPYYGFLNLNSRAYCVDGTYFPDRWLPAPCDTSSCLPMPDHVQLRASEYVQIGEAPSGDCGRDGGVAAFESGADRDAGRRQVPNIESRAAAAPLAVRVTYYGDHTCSAGALTVDVPVE